MAEAVRARLWADPGRTRFWLVPEDAALGTGSFAIEGVGGAKKAVDERALDRYGIPRDEARRRAGEEMAAYMAKVRPSAKPIADFLRGFAKGLGMDPSGFDVPTDDAAVEMFMNPNGVRDYVDAVTAEPDTVIEPRKPLTQDQQDAVAAMDALSRNPRVNRAIDEAARQAEAWVKKNAKKDEEEAS